MINLEPSATILDPLIKRLDEILAQLRSSKGCDPDLHAEAKKLIEQARRFVAHIGAIKDLSNRLN